jgi:hypothetical protein
VAWLKNWSALIHLNLKVDTTLAFNPGVTFKTPMVPAEVTLGDHSTQVFSQMYTFGVGGNFSGQAIRTEDVTFFYPFDATFFNTPDNPGTSCYRYGGLTIGAKPNSRIDHDADASNQGLDFHVSNERA